MALELVLSQLLERRLGPVARPLKEGRSGRLMRLAKAAGACGLAVRAAGRRRERLRTAASALTLTSGLVLRYAWLGAGPPSAADDAMVAMVARAED